MLAIGTAGQRDTPLGVCPVSVPATVPQWLRDTPGHCPAMSRVRPGNGGSCRPAKTRHTPHNFFFAHFTSRRGPNDAATTRRKWAIYDFVPRTSASHTEGTYLQKHNVYGSF